MQPDSVAALPISALPADALPADSASGAAGPKPYVGARPFERHERHLFFGREREAGFIRDKIFAARLTLLYAPSGVGKSSILRTSVIPQLEDEGALPIYFDAWTCEDPVGALKEALAARAAELGLPNARAGAPTLAELVRLISSVDGRTVVLVLDQFDELLNFHAGHLAPVRKELGALVRAAGVDARVLIALRQEFLAALEPFRADILNLFSSTYLLGPLDAAGMREAIERPVKQFGATFEPALTDTLIADLGGGSQKGGDVSVELPMLQIVCARLWDATQRQGQQLVTRQLYQRLGGARKILEAYVKEVMPPFGGERVLTAELMQYLAPRSGFKMSYSVQDLAAVVRRKPARLEPQLRRLAARHILRVRSYSSGPRYELQHDALIPLITPWRKDVQKRARAQRLWLWGLGATAAVSMLLWLTAIWVANRQIAIELQLHRLVGAVAEADPGSPGVAAALDKAANYAVNQAPHEASFSTIRPLLESLKDRIPQDYGLTPLDQGARLDPGSGASVKVRYAASRPLDRRRFVARWKTEAEQIMAQRGIPVPLRVELEEEVGFPKQLITVQMPGADPVDLRLQAYDARDAALIGTADLTDQSRDIFQHFPDPAWTAAPDLSATGEYYLVPRWSLPLWKVTNTRIIDVSDAVASVVAARLLERPDRLLTPATFDFLMERAEAAAPETVREARASRGAQLREDLVAFIRTGGSLRNLEMVLDAFARYRKGTSNEVAQHVQADLTGGPLRALDQPLGPRSGQRPARAGALASAQGGGGESPFADVEPLLPDQTRVRVMVGRDLRERWFSGRQLAPEVERVTEEVREALFQQYGVDAPAPGFKYDPDLDEDELRVEVLDQCPEHDSDKARLKAVGERGLQTYREALQARLEEHRTHWISAAFVSAQLEQMRPATRSWLERHYALPDLELMLRQVVSAEVGPGQGVPPQHTIRHTRWLLRSLVFWSAVEGSGSLRGLAARLAQTEQARLQEGHPPAISPSEAMAAGLRALESGDCEQAHAAFLRAARQDREGAVRAFLDAYPGTVQSGLAGSAKVCQDAQVSLTREQRSDVSDFLRSGKASAAQEQSLRICLFHDKDSRDPVQRWKLAADLLQRYGNVTSWTPPDAWQVGAWVEANAERFDGRVDASRLLLYAFPRLPASEARRVFREQVDACDGAGKARRCWSLLEQLAEQRPADVVTDFAEALSGSERVEDLEKAADLLEQAAVEGGDQQRLECARANVRATLSLAPGHALKRPQRQAISQLVASQRCDPGLARALAVALAAGGRPLDAAQLVDRELQRQPASPELLMGQLVLALDRGDRKAAEEIAGRASQLEEAASSAFARNHADAPRLLQVAAVAQWATQTGHWDATMRRFVYSGQPDAPYVALMLSGSLAARGLSDDAKEALTAWQGLDPAALHARLGAGDERAWPELLISCALGKEPWAKVIEPLQTEEAFQASEYGGTRLSRERMLTEAYFYEQLSALAAHDAARAREGLERVAALQQHRQIELHLARYLGQAAAVQ